MSGGVPVPSIDGIRNLLVIGSGTMGSQIGMVAALAGYETTVQDISAESLATARSELTARMGATVAKGRLAAAQAEAALGRLSFATDLDASAAGADFVIEAATERLDIKEQIFTRFIAQATYAETGDPADRPNPAVAALVAQGRLGRKSGSGFYEYDR